MPKRVQRVPVHLDAAGIRNLSFDEIRAILRGADLLIMQGGRTLLAKILKGSRSKDVIERKLNRSYAYGYFSEFSIEQITAKIDWTILQEYLEIRYDWRLPLIIYAEKGWEIEKDTISDELLNEFQIMIESISNEYDLSHLKDRPRDLIFLLLEKIRARNDPRFIPLLEAWAEIDYKKVRERIHNVIHSIILCR
jgi:hypothetical protein